MLSKLADAQRLSVTEGWFDNMVRTIFTVRELSETPVIDTQKTFEEIQQEVDKEFEIEKQKLQTQSKCRYYTIIIIQLLLSKISFVLY